MIIKNTYILSLNQVANQNIYNLTTEIQSQHEMASPEKVQKCRYDFLAFT